MHVGQRHEQAIPFWGRILLACCIFALIPSCANRNEQAARHASLALQALNGNNLATARAEIAAAIADRDDIVDYHILRGRIEMAAGSQGAAFDAYNNALALDAANAEALLAVAQLGLTTGNVRESLDATERLLSLAPNNPDALLVRGIHSIVARNYPEAILYADKILANSPDYEGGLVLKARALFMLNKPDDALATVKKISDPQSIPAALTRLEIYRALRQSSKMLPEFELLRRLRSTDLSLRLDEANLRLKTGDRNIGNGIIIEILASSQATADVVDQALALWLEYGARDLTESELEMVGRGTAASRTGLARFLLEHGRPVAAATIIARLPADTSQGLKARLLMRTGQADYAMRLATAVLQHDKTNCDALIAASEAALDRHEADDGLRFSQQASSECPSLVSSWVLSANAYDALGRNSGVSRVYAQALETNKQSTPLTAAYSEWLVSQGRIREAVAIAKRLTEYAPALLSGWRLYGDLCRKFDHSCLAEATRGLANARTLPGIDLRPGTMPPNGLFGRFVAQ